MNGDSTVQSNDFDYMNEQFADELKQLGKVNILIVGKTGAGKSTLINNVFSGRVAQCGIGRPVTAETTYYEHASGALGIWDTKGVETGESRAKIGRWIREELARPRTEDQRINLAWYTVRAGDRRIEEGQLELIRELRAAQIPVVLVVTQVYRNAAGETSASAKEFISVLEDIAREEHIDAVIPIAAEADGCETPTVHGLDALMSTSHRLVGDAARRALEAAQIVQLHRQRKRAMEAVQIASLAALGTGAAPLPGSDAVALVPIQLGMIARISACYALPIPGRDLGKAVLPIIMGSATTAAGKGLVTAILKMVPGVNLVVSAVSGAVAFSLTQALGWAWIGACELMVKFDLTQLDDASIKVLRDAFASNLKQGFDSTNLKAA